jgi:pimeloyl-ACP methyl ester carboxylesterase
MKIKDDVPLQYVPNSLGTAQTNAVAEAAAQKAAWKRFEIHRHCARLSLQVYGAQVDKVRVSNIEEGIFVNETLNLRAMATLIDGEAYVAFRGTVGLFGLSRNWLKVNLCAAKTGEPPRHRGFWNAWLTLQANVRLWLDAKRPTSLNLTGHSMGAAIAQFAALDLCSTWPVRGVILFATPMIGTVAFNRTYEQATVASTSQRLTELTVRYLLLSDAISLPLPRLMGYEPALPIVPIDQNGIAPKRVPGVIEQAVDLIIGQQQLPESSQAPPAIFIYSAYGGKLDLEQGTMIEDGMGWVRMLAMVQGTWVGWLSLLALAMYNALRRAVGFHQMKLYAIALRAFPLQR